MATNWALFAAGANGNDLIGLPSGSRLTHYTIDSCRVVLGEAPSIEAGSPLVRIETAEPLALPGIPAAHQFRGTAQHLNYTSDAQRADLEARSRTPFDNVREVICVMIPIAKSSAWWQLSPDARTAHFQRSAAHHQHVAIGAPYVERIYRKLYHSRYVGGAEAPIPYDFVTYFEFLEADRAAFEELLAGLRDTKRNPEWGFVEHEFEVWMRRV